MASFRIIWEGAILTFAENDTQTLEKAADVSAARLGLGVPASEGLSAP